MPGRPSNRSSVASHLSKKASSQTLGTSRRNTTSPTSYIPDEGPTNELRININNIFGDAQHSNTAHRKLVVSLRKIQEACVDKQPAPQKHMGHDFAQYEEIGFQEEFSRCTVRLMTVKKSESVGDRLVRFIGLFLKHAGDQGMSPVSNSRLFVLSYVRCGIRSR